MSHPSTPASKPGSRIRLGYYMYAPIVGGAEQHFKDLVRNADQARYQVFVFCEPWEKFVRFLELGQCPWITFVPVPVTEPIGHIADQATGSVGRDTRDKSEALLGLLRSFGAGTGLARIRPLRQLLSLLLRYGMMPGNYFRLRQAFRRVPLDLLHIVNGGYPASQTAQLAALAARRAGCPKVVMSVTNVPYPRTFPRLGEAWLDHRMQRVLDRILVPSDNIGAAMVAERGFLPGQVQKIYYGAADLSATAPAEWGSGDGTTPIGNGPVVGMVANFLPHKGYRHLIEAAVGICRVEPRVKFLLVGNGPDFNAIQRLVAEKGLTERVTFAGRCNLDETLGLMKTFAVFVLSSELEGMPYVLIHAMNLGLPLVASNVGAVSEMIVEGETGYLVPPSDVGALRDRILRLLVDLDAARAMGRRGQCRYEENFTLRLMLCHHAQLYDSLACAGQKTGHGLPSA